MALTERPTRPWHRRIVVARRCGRSAGVPTVRRLARHCLNSLGAFIFCRARVRYDAPYLRTQNRLAHTHTNRLLSLYSAVNAYVVIVVVVVVVMAIVVFSGTASE